MLAASGRSKESRYILPPAIRIHEARRRASQTLYLRSDQDFRDLHAAHLRSIAAWRVHAGLANIRPPQPIDLSDPAWSPAPSDGKGPDKLLAIFCANVIHIAPWRVAEGLFAGAARHLRADGRLFLYGPFKRGGKHTALSNAVFDTSLRERDAEWGVRDIADVEALAEQVGLKLGGSFEMPANNLILMFVRKDAAQA